MPSKTNRPAATPSATDKQKEQSARFIETAHKLEADESGKTFQDAIGRLLVPKQEATHSHPSVKKGSS